MACWPSKLLLLHSIDINVSLTNINLLFFYAWHCTLQSLSDALESLVAAAAATATTNPAHPMNAMQEKLRAALHDAAWLWVGSAGGFVPSSQVLYYITASLR
jgi:hypothetical protein